MTIAAGVLVGLLVLAGAGPFVHLALRREIPIWIAPGCVVTLIAVIALLTAYTFWHRSTLELAMCSLILMWVFFACFVRYRTATVYRPRLEAMRAARAAGPETFREYIRSLRKRKQA